MRVPTDGLAASQLEAPSVAEYLLAAFVLLGWLVAALAPAVMLPESYHSFADQRAWLAVPNVIDVFTNLPFAVVGWYMVLASTRARGQLSSAHFVLGCVTGVGLMATMLCSSIYHLRPDAAGLALDRVGMSLAFAGVLGLAAANRISDRAGWWLACAVGLLAPWAAAWDWHTGNMTPWAVLQGGGLVLLLALAICPERPASMRIPLWSVLGFYAVAKILELADGPVLALTHGLISGHSAKHLVAALALWPVASSLQRFSRKS